MVSKFFLFHRIQWNLLLKPSFTDTVKDFKQTILWSLFTVAFLLYVSRKDFNDTFRLWTKLSQNPQSCTTTVQHKQTWPIFIEVCIWCQFCLLFVQGSNSCSEDHQERGQISRGCKTWGQCSRKNSGKRSK